MDLVTFGTAVGNQLQWNGSLEELKRFFSNTLNIRGKWKSLGGDVKMFSSQNEELNVKWNGPKSKKINIVKDINNMFFDTMKNHASKGKSLSIELDSDELDAHVVEAVSVDNSESQNESEKSINDEAQGNLDQILTCLHELEEKTRNESRERPLLIDENKKMAAEINQLKSTVITLNEDNDRVLTLLDNKQNAWIQVEAKK